jgi:hypothetical protein
VQSFIGNAQKLLFNSGYFGSKFAHGWTETVFGFGFSFDAYDSHRLSLINNANRERFPNFN